MQVAPSPMSGVPHNAGPALQWGGLLDSELVTIMEAPARHLRRWAPAGENRMGQILVVSACGRHTTPD